ncbi:hypothetical protein BH09BAC2_BH09BAC2_04130 [soil metagenome]
MTDPIVSICIPTYNGAEFLKEAVDSAIAQSYKNIEILISDDGSEDETIPIIKQYAEKYNSIRLVANPVKGMVNNWNNCLREAKGEWIKFLFQDDILQPDCVEMMYNRCVHYNATVAVCRRDFIIHENVSPGLRKYFSGSIKKPEHIFSKEKFISADELAETVSKHLLKNVLGEPTCYFFKRNIADQPPEFLVKLRQVVDYEFIIRIGLINGLVFLPQTLALFRVHKNSVSNAVNRVSEENKLKNLRAVFGDFILLLQEFLNSPALVAVKDKAGTLLLEQYIKHLYYSGCKHHGVGTYRKALHEIFIAYPEIAGLKYNFFKYVFYRYRIRKVYGHQ